MSYQRTLAVGVLLLFQAFVIQFVANGRRVPLAAPLEAIPTTLGKWTMLQEGHLTESEMQVLRADQVLVRTYQTAAGAATTYPMSLLVAYFEAQVEGRTPHSPKNCLPGSGWEPIESSIISVSVPGSDAPIPVNRYLLAKDDARIVMFYWYQSSRRAVASEYSAKLYLVGDALTKRRTESSIVRITAPLQHAGDKRTEEEAIDMIRLVYPAVKSQLPI